MIQCGLAPHGRRGESVFVLKGPGEMGLALKAGHLGYLFDGEGTVLYQGLGLSKAFLGEEAEDGRTVHLLETVLEFVFIGAHL